MNDWLPRGEPDPAARVRLFCFPHAGGAASAFRLWQQLLPWWVDVLPVQLPGRENRANDTACADLEQLAGMAAEGLASYLEPPFAFFGHSMGAILAYELALRVREPAHLIVAGHRAPHVPDPCPLIYDLPDAEFLQALREFNGTPPELFDDPELLNILLPTLRADFTLSDTYRYQPRPPLDCAITVLCGRDDGAVPDPSGWHEHTSGRCDVVRIPGGHFFVHSAAPIVTGVVQHRLHEVWRGTERRLSPR